MIKSKFFAQLLLSRICHSAYIYICYPVSVTRVCCTALILQLLSLSISHSGFMYKTHYFHQHLSPNPDIQHQFLCSVIQLIPRNSTQDSELQSACCSLSRMACLDPGLYLQRWWDWPFYVCAASLGSVYQMMTNGCDGVWL